MNRTIPLLSLAMVSSTLAFNSCPASAQENLNQRQVENILHAGLMVAYVRCLINQGRTKEELQVALAKSDARGQISYKKYLGEPYVDALAGYYLPILGPTCHTSEANVNEANVGALKVLESSLRANNSRLEREIKSQEAENARMQQLLNIRKAERNARSSDRIVPVPSLPWCSQNIENGANLALEGLWEKNYPLEKAMGYKAAFELLSTQIENQTAVQYSCKPLLRPLAPRF